MTASSSSSPAPILAGIQRALPIVLGYVPVAFAFGVLAVQNHIPPGFAVFMSVVLFAGSGQFVAASLWGAGAGAVTVILMVFVVNLRHLLMSAALAPHLKPLARWQKFIFGYQMTDETFAVHSSAFQQGWALVVPTLYACNITAHGAWVGGTVLGVIFGSLITDVRPLGLDYALIAMFLALLVPQCRERLHVVVALVALVLSVGLRLAGLGQWNVCIATVLAAMLGVYLQCRAEGRCRV
ncbi:MAG: AzlC family ABC transporter permease [Desulfovibrionaceae bacterium]